MPRFVVHEHHATRLHWDFRLEMDGALRSWAVPKGPPEEAGVKRLAVEVELHPLDYIDFHGVIEEGYGAGTVEIWDSGTYEILRREDKFLEFVLAGSRLGGRYKLIFTGYGGGKGWLLVKGKPRDGAAAAPAPEAAPAEAEPAPKAAAPDVPGPKRRAKRAAPRRPAAKPAPRKARRKTPPGK